MDVLRSNAEFEAWRARVGDRQHVLVPTMGGLHEGHLSLVRIGADYARERALAGGVVATVFVNPTQFDQASDFERYPRVLEEDASACAEAGASAVFAPRAEDVYPPGLDVPVPALPPMAVGPGLEDRYRPGHVEGVCQVVKRLFELCRPAAAVFGEKDWQQLQVVTALSAMHGLGVEVLPGPIVREADGLAMSSRNRFLPNAERAAAAAVSASLRAAQAIDSPAEAEAAMRDHLASRGLGIDYAVLREARTLMPLGDAWHETRDEARALVVARLGSVRLLDNAPWPG